MAIDDPDYQQFDYTFATNPCYPNDDMTRALRAAVRATIKHLVGTPLRYLEIGVWEGRSGCWMLDNVLTHEHSSYLGIDNWTSPPEVPISARRNLGYHGQKAQLIERDSKEVVPTLHGRFDIIFVDGLHTYAGCYADLYNVWPKLISGGYLIVDDYAYPGLPGVPQAVNQWATEHTHDATVLFKDIAIVFRKEDKQPNGDL